MLKPVLFQGGFKVRSETTLLMVATMARNSKGRTSSAISSFQLGKLHPPRQPAGSLYATQLARATETDPILNSAEESDMEDNLVIVIPDSSGLADVN